VLQPGSEVIKILQNVGKSSPTMRNIPEELNIKQQHSQHLNPIKHNL
jgi:hypothetical protein